MKTNGWISISRDIRNHWVWRNPRHLRYWLDIILQAQWEPKQIMVGNKPLTLKRGQFATSIRILKGQWNCTGDTVISFLKVLEKDGMIERKFHSKITIITVKNYDNYQSIFPSDFGPMVERKVEHLLINNKEQNNNPSSSLEEKNFEFQNQCLNDQIFLEQIAKNNFISIEKAKEFLPTFTKQALERNKGKETLSEYKDYFCNWIRLTLRPKKTKDSKQFPSTNEKDKYTERRGTNAGNHDKDAFKDSTAF